MVTQIPEAIRNEISIQLKCSLIDFAFASGGCINHGGRLQTSRDTYFLKWNSAEQFPEMFLAEADGLELLRTNSSLRIPHVISHGTVEGFQFLILEFIAQAKPSATYWKKLGERLSDLHKKSSSDFGLEFDNYIGSLPQRNNVHKTWTTFFIEERLKPQVARAIKTGKIDSRITSTFEILYENLTRQIVEEKPALLHGDLWSGNLIVDEHGDPCLIDPAVFYGNREAEIAFTKLFGGFSNEFYEVYNTNFPLEKGFESRSDLYNLYPLMVHVNLFGGGYLNQVVSILKNTYKG